MIIDECLQKTDKSFATLEMTADQHTVGQVKYQ